LRRAKFGFKWKIGKSCKGESNADVKVETNGEDSSERKAQFWTNTPKLSLQYNIALMQQGWRQRSLAQPREQGLLSEQGHIGCLMRTVYHILNTMSRQERVVPNAKMPHEIQGMCVIISNRQQRSLSLL